MNRKQQIAFYKSQLAEAETLKSCGRQIIANAARIESEAKRALDMLGNSSGRTRKGKNVLSESQELKLIGSLTKSA